MTAEIAVGGPEHVSEITRPCGQCFPDADVVFEDLARSCRNVRRAVEKMFDHVRGKRFQLFIRITSLLHFIGQGRFEEFVGEMKAEQKHSFAVGSCSSFEQRGPVETVPTNQLRHVTNPAQSFPQMPRTVYAE